MLATRLPSPQPGPILAILGVNLAIAGAFAAGLALPLVALALLVPLGIAVSRRPQRGILALAALLPFHGLLTIAPVPTWAKVWKEVLVVGVLAATFMAPAAARARRRPLPRWAPALGGLLVLSSVSAPGVGPVRAFWGIKIAFFFVLVAVAAWRCPLDAAERDRLVSILMVTGAVTAAYGIAQQAMGHARLHSLGYPYDVTIRFTGSFLRSFSSFNLPFPFAYFLVMVILVGLAHSLPDLARARSRLFLLSLPVLGVALVFTFVRGAWIGLAVGIAYLGFARFRVLLLGIPLVALALLFLPSELSTAALQSRSGSQRVATWKDNLSALTDHPMGLGLASSGSAAEKSQVKRSDGSVLVTDNDYYRALFELGVLGLWMLVLLLAATFSAARRASSQPASPQLGPPDRDFAVSVAATILAVAAISVVANFFDSFPLAFYFWLLVTVVETSKPVDSPVART